MALDKNFENFIVYIIALKASWKSTKMPIHLSLAAQLSDGYHIGIAALQQDKAPFEVPAKYINYFVIFSFDLAI